MSSNCVVSMRPSSGDSACDSYTRCESSLPPFLSALPARISKPRTAASRAVQPTSTCIEGKHSSALQLLPLMVKTSSPSCNMMAPLIPVTAGPVTMFASPHKAVLCSARDVPAATVWSARTARCRWTLNVGFSSASSLPTLWAACTCVCPWRWLRRSSSTRRYWNTAIWLAATLAVSWKEEAARTTTSCSRLPIVPAKTVLRAVSTVVQSGTAAVNSSVSPICTGFRVLALTAAATPFGGGPICARQTS